MTDFKALKNLFVALASISNLNLTFDVSDEYVKICFKNAQSSKVLTYETSISHNGSLSKEELFNLKIKTINQLLCEILKTI